MIFRSSWRRTPALWRRHGRAIRHRWMMYLRRIGTRSGTTGFPVCSRIPLARLHTQAAAAGGCAGSAGAVGKIYRIAGLGVFCMVLGAARIGQTSDFTHVGAVCVCRQRVLSASVSGAASAVQACAQGAARELAAGIGDVYAARARCVPRAQDWLRHLPEQNMELVCNDWGMIGIGQAGGAYAGVRNAAQQTPKRCPPCV